jgi:hypothetical protein
MRYILEITSTIGNPHLAHDGAIKVSKHFSQYFLPSASSTNPQSRRRRLHAKLAQVKCSGHQVFPVANTKEPLKST